MTDDGQGPENAAQLLRARRVAQIAAITGAGLSIITARSVLHGNTMQAVALTVGIATMLLCLGLNRRGRTDAASLLLVTTMALLVCWLIWIGEGLRDSALLVFPAVLITAALLVRPSEVAGLLVGILLAVLAIGGATLMGWRVDMPPDELPDRMLDSVLILLVSGFAVWLMIGDLRRLLARLRVQVERYRESQANLTYLSQHDALTQLPNRILGRSRIDQAIANARRNGGHLALLFVDLDNFKAINDSLGHTAGDDFLVQVAQRLCSTVRKTDVVSRQGGDEFLVCITDVAESAMVSHVAQKILGRIAEPYAVRGTELAGSCSVGIALFPQNGDDFETLLRNADLSVYHAKDAGRNVFRFYDESMNARMQQDLLLLAALRTAIAQQEFVLHYQPVVDLGSGRIVGAEALVRWTAPGRGLVPPGEFIPAAERSGLIADIGRWVLGEACRQQVAWQSEGLAPIVLAVNLSPVQFRRGDVEADLAKALSDNRLDGRWLELELTESSLVQDAERFTVSLQRLKATGVRIAIDDFGTGYSNLSYLQRFSIDKLKIDQSFVRRLTQGTQDQAIVQAIIQIARSLELTTTAEGIEDATTRERLVALGCGQGQGYLFARPLPAQAFAELLRAGQPLGEARGADGG